ncbi:hypothetical protein INT47_010507 [Mucor saturninus]|uniref:Uncharacterized protein n=1 Tax=Mucor saturninus TaxID=64648 RepID=A0A8H7V5P8_9FUNG|nr:hypothetical protein INT47_010507 [Mucor saturninus]
MEEQEKSRFKAGFSLGAMKEVNQEQEEELAAQTEAAEKEEGVAETDGDSAPRPSKRRKRLDIKKVKKLDLGGKVEKIVEYFFNGKQVLDLSKGRTIPSRFIPKIDQIRVRCLTLYPNASIKPASIPLSIKLIFSVSQAELSFIKMAIMKLCLLYHEELLEGEHNEVLFLQIRMPIQRLSSIVDTLSCDSKKKGMFGDAITAMMLGESEMRMVTWNFEAIKAMIRTTQQDNMTFLARPNTSNIYYRENSTGSEGSDSTHTDSSSSSVDISWEEDKKKLRVMENIESNLAELSKKANEQYVSSSWEDIVFSSKQPE